MKILLILALAFIACGHAAVPPVTTGGAAVAAPTPTLVSTASATPAPSATSKAAPTVLPVVTVAPKVTAYTITDLGSTGTKVVFAVSPDFTQPGTGEGNRTPTCKASAYYDTRFVTYGVLQPIRPLTFLINWGAPIGGSSSGHLRVTISCDWLYPYPSIQLRQLSLFF